MNREEKDIKVIKRLKVVIMVFGILSIFNIIILIGRNQSYALFRRNVQSKRIIEIHTASEFPVKEGRAVDIIKSTLGKDGGIIGVTTDNTKTTDKNANNIREYRYSGLGAKNYVKFNDELWRIIGIFKDEAGEEHLKIVRNEVLPASAMPDTYTVSGTSYKIRYSSSATAYWDYSGTYNNNWADSGLMNWLNSKGTADGYLKTLSRTARGMIEETKWYLGNVYYGDTAVQSYEHERGSTACSSSCSGGDVWSGNSATWTGKIGLMYQSDYGYSIDSSYWSTKKLDADYSSFRDSSWIYKEANHSDWEWFLSPSSDTSYNVANWSSDGHVKYYRACDGSGVRPSLNLKSIASIIKGTGEKNSPYELNYVIPIAVDTIKATMGQEGGIIGVTTDNIKVTEEADNIREYRYSGLGVKNYVKFNDELWRIIGIFKDVYGQEHLKIVRNERLPASAMPDTYTVSGKSYKIRSSSYSNYAFWDYDGSNYDNNWGDAGLMNWLNSTGTENGYLKKLSSTAQIIIAETKWYLGNVWLTDTTVQSYENERKNTKCSVTSNSHDSNCYIWPNNEATWYGKIGLMYQSDYGYSIDSSYWSTKKLNDYNSFRDSSWMYKEANHLYDEWFLSPSSLSTKHVSAWSSGGNANSGSANVNIGIRPSLYLKSSAGITSGTGEQGAPYELV